MMNTEYNHLRRGRETLDPTKHSAGDCKESFYLERLSDSAEPLPVLLETEKDLISSFHSKLESISLLILSGLEKVVGVKAQAFTSCHGGAENRLRLIHYPGIGKEAGSYVMKCMALQAYLFAESCNVCAVRRCAHQRIQTTDL